MMLQLIEDLLFLSYKAYVITITIIVLAVVIERYMETPPSRIRVKKTSSIRSKSD